MPGEESVILIHYYSLDSLFVPGPEANFSVGISDRVQTLGIRPYPYQESERGQGISGKKRQSTQPVQRVNGAVQHPCDCRVPSPCIRFIA